MYWARAVTPGDLVDGYVYVHGNNRLNLETNDVATFVTPADAALMFGFRALDAGAPFEQSFPVWMATLRRRGESEAIVESLQRVYAQLADQGSLSQLMIGLCEHARSLGYRKVSFAGSLLREPMMAPALKPVAEHLGRPVELVPTTGMFSFQLGPTTVTA